jgi:hypothetical protein
VFVGGVAFAGSGATTAKVTVGVYIDTAASANADMQHAATANGNAQSIQTAVRAATGFGSSDATVVPAYMVGGSIVSGTGAVSSTAY